MGIAALALAAGGCAGPIQREELKRGIETLHSTAAEGRLLANGVAGDRTRATFSRVHARDLADIADHQAEKLSDAEATGRLRIARDRAVALAQEISDALGDLRVNPGEEAVGRRVEDQLRKLADDADALAHSL